MPELRWAQTNSEPERYRLRLYVAGQTPSSIRAFANLKRICETHLAGQYEIEVVDLLKNPKLATGDQILAIPTLVRTLPPPIKKIIGDLSNTERVLVGLDVRLSIAEYLEKELGERFTPPQLLRDKVARGELGKKSGRGFYDWA